MVIILYLSLKQNGGRIEQRMDYFVIFASGNHPKTNMTINRIYI